MTQAIARLEARLSACRDVLVDSNVLLDVAPGDPAWGGWSALDAVLPAASYRREPLPWDAGFLAGKCFLQYRRRGGSRTSPLPDFYIGAHAAIGRLALLTRDAARYRNYFPTVEILAPIKRKK